MTLYPKWNDDSNPADHLLFDLGYTYAMLARAEELLQEVLNLGELGWVPEKDLCARVSDLLIQMESQRKGRLRFVNEIYAAAQQAANRGTPHQSQRERE